MTTEAKKIINRRDTAENWRSANPILMSGEIGIDTTNQAMKIGDGSTAWNDLKRANDFVKGVVEFKFYASEGVKADYSGFKLNAIGWYSETKRLIGQITATKVSDGTTKYFNAVFLTGIESEESIPHGVWEFNDFTSTYGTHIVIDLDVVREKISVDKKLSPITLTEYNIYTTVEKTAELAVKNAEAAALVYEETKYERDALVSGFYKVGTLSIGDTAPDSVTKYVSDPYLWGCMMIRVFKGDKVTIKTKGGSNGRAYALTDADRVILEMADADVDTRATPVTLAIACDGYLYVNSTPATDSAFQVKVNSPITNKIASLQRDVDSMKGNVVSTPHMYNPVLDLRKPQLRVLDIGNSYTQDSTNYLPQLIEAAGVDTSDMCLYTAIRPSASFKVWYDIYHDRNTVEYGISKKFGGLDADVSGSAQGGLGEKFRKTLQNNEWDLIIIHQVSSYAPYYDRWEEDSDAGYLSKLIRLIRKHQPQATIGFLLTHSYWSGYASNTEKSSYERWKLIAESAKRLRANYGIDFIVPYGTAIQNIRTSSLNTEHDLTNDGTHCAAGLGDYTASCAYYQALIAPRYGVSILGNSYRVNVSQTGTYPDSEVSVTDDNALTAQKAAFLACYDWYEVINPETVDEV